MALWNMRANYPGVPARDREDPKSVKGIDAVGLQNQGLVFNSFSASREIPILEVGSAEIQMHHIRIRISPQRGGVKICRRARHCCARKSDCSG